MSKTIKSIKGGNTTISATYKGVTVQKSITVNKYTPTITLSATDRSCNGNPLYASATVNIPSGGKTAKGTIYYGTTSGSQSYSVTYSGSAVNLSSVSVTNPGNVTVYAYFVPDSTCNDVYNNSGNYSKKMTISCVAANKGSVNSPSVTFSTSSQTTSLSVSGASGTVTYPTSITVTKGGSSVTGWSCNSSGTLTIPASATAGTYTVAGTINIAASGCYCSGSDNKSWTVTINKKPITVTVTCANVSCGGTTTASLGSGSNPGSGTVTWSSGSTSKATVNSSGTVTGVAVTSSVRITASVAETTNYQAGSGYKDIAVTCVAGTLGAVSNPAAQTYKTSGTYSFTIGLGSSTGTVTYPSSISVTKGGSAVSGWTISGTTVTVPTGTSAGSYTVTGNCSVAASGCYCAVGATSRSWTITINKAPITVTVSCANVSCGGTTTASLGSGSNPGSGTVTWSSGSTSKATVNSSGTVTGVAVTSSVRITASVAETTNYQAGSGYKDIAVTCVAGSTGVSTSAMTITYSSTTATRAISGKTGTVSIVSTSNSNVATATVNSANDTITVTRTGYGSATITVRAAASGCYCQKDSTFTVNCNKAAGGVTITDAQPRYGSGNAVATASGATGTVYYRLGTSGSFSTTMPTTGSNGAGSYTLYYYVAEATNYTAFGSSSSPKSLTVTIKKALRSGAVSCNNVNCGSKVQASVSGNTESGAVTWGTSNSSIATVNTSGEVTGVAPGTVNITASVAATTNYEAYTATQKQITVNALTGATGVSTSTMTITYSSTTGTRTVSGNTGTVTVSSSNTNIATVAISGTTITVTRKGYGSATITCSAAASGCYAATSSTFTVNCNRAGRSGAVSCNNVNCGSTVQASVSGNTESGTVTWGTSNSNIATVNTSGVVTAVAPGSVDITASVAQTTNYLAYTATKKTITVNTLTGVTGVSTDTMTITYSTASATRTVSGNTGTVTVSSSNTNIATVAISGSTITVTRKGYGSATITVNVAASGCYAANSSTFTVTCAKAAGSVTVTNANPTYGTSNALASVSGATGTVYYRLGTSGSFSTTIPTASGLTANSYTLYYYVAESTNYTNFGTSSSPKSVSVSVAKASNQITISPTSKTIYDRSGYNTFTITVSNYKGTVTASSNNTGKATVTKVDNATFTVTYAGAGSAIITVTDNGGTNYVSSSANSTVTTKVDTISSYGTVSTPSVSQKTNFPAGGVTLTSSNMSTYFTTSGSTQTNTWASGYTSSGSVSYSWSVSSGTVASKGTTISNASTVTINATVTATGDGSKTATKSVTSGTQVGNYVTAITPKSSSNTDGTHFSYANIGAGATSASPSLSGGALYTFSSGSTTFNASGSPSFGGSATYTRQYTLASSQNGFTAVNSSTGVLTATSRGKTTGAARASANVTGTLVVTYTHASSYSTGGTVTSSTKSNTQTCTQNANYLTIGNVSLTVSSPATPYSMSVSGETKAISASASQSGTYSSGSTDTYTPTISYAVKTAVTGYSLSSNSVTVTNNTSTSARNGFVVTVTAAGVTGTDSTYISGYNKTATSDRTFNQVAGSKSYGTPTVTFTYTNTAASGVTNKAPTTVTYSQPWTWNGVSGSGGNITSGLTLSYSTTGTLPTGFSKGTNFATTGAITWASRGTTVGSQLNANNNIVLSIPFADQTRTYNPTGCTQSENALTGIAISLGSNPINYNTTTTATVTATYTSGSSKDVTSSLSTSSSATSNFIKSGDTSVVTIS